MRSSLLWLLWLVLPVFVLAYHYGPGQIWLARDRAAAMIRQAEARAGVATEAQSAAYEAQLHLLDARRAAFAADVDWQTQVEHPLAKAVLTATEKQNSAYANASELWHATAERYGQAIETLLKVETVANQKHDHAELPQSDRQLLESLRWAEARAMVRSGEVFNGIEQLQALLDLRVAEAHQRAASAVHPASTAGNRSDRDRDSHALPIDAIREELAAAQYVGARLLREEGRPPEVWRPVANAARQHYRYLSANAIGVDAEQVVSVAARREPSGQNRTSSPLPPGGSRRTENQVDDLSAAGNAPTNLDRSQRMQRNLEQVLNLEQSVSDQLEGLPLPRNAPLARRPGDGEPGDQPGGKQPGRGPLQDGPPSAGAGIPGPRGVGW
ncbi:secreted protein [Rhodopirellula maiorica SM1]|uniref:Secreted protein n=1 Tax=Rhodopirellula maiorica SM1 TaxID=1265738 RepID=M5RS95_9BACT|nr:hypothetical protein [Rhodopirellula maiorica]EMI18252.1 secreted protein [Rhodopirellula maiorica SM1]